MGNLVKTGCNIKGEDDRELTILITPSLKAYHWYSEIMGLPYRIICSKCSRWLKFYDGLLHCEKCNKISGKIKIGKFNYATWKVDVELL